MPINENYRRQVALLLRCIPAIDKAMARIQKRVANMRQLAELLGVDLEPQQLTLSAESSAKQKARSAKRNVRRKSRWLIVTTVVAINSAEDFVGVALPLVVPGFPKTSLPASHMSYRCAT